MEISRRLLLVTPFLLAAATLASAQPESADKEGFFEAKIRPLLMDRCFKCHGGEKINNGLRVDSRAALVKGGYSGPAIVPGQAAKSLLMKALRHEKKADLRMPPDGKLPDAVVTDVATWIDAGAVWPASVVAKENRADAASHWAF